jgi:hypothetical protein
MSVGAVIAAKKASRTDIRPFSPPTLVPTPNSGESPVSRNILFTTAVLAAVVTTACSDVTAPERFAPESTSRHAAAGTDGGRPCAAPGTQLPGALNMLHDPTMFTTPMARDAAQGTAGMFHAVAVSGC